MEKILEYLVEKYQPEGMIVYGSFADGSYNENSDFDVLVIASGEKRHDASVVDGTVLDAFVYPPETFAGAFDPADFVQIFDGKIVLDSKGVAAKLRARVLAYLDALPMKAMDEVRQDVAWCRKMQSRTLRGDAEGFFRWHWLLTESLLIYCDARRWHYFGPKKALRQMQREQPGHYAAYRTALEDFTQSALSGWLDCLEESMDS